jgi:four helix bundle protein
MANEGSFEDLIAWQKARALVRVIYGATRTAAFSRDFPLVDQIRRASVSIMSNIAEGFERGRRAEFHQFLVVAKGSCGEVRSQLYVALDAEYLDQKAFQKLHEMTTELGKVLGGLRTAVRNQRDPKP